jgi:hypothetical protein
VGTDEGILDGSAVGEEYGIHEGTDVGAPVGRDVGPTVGAEVGRDVGYSSVKTARPSTMTSDGDVIIDTPSTTLLESLNLLLPSENTSHPQVVLVLVYDTTEQLTSFTFRPPLMTPLELTSEQVGSFLSVLQL